MATKKVVKKKGKSTAKAKAVPKAQKEDLWFSQGQEAAKEVEAEAEARSEGGGSYGPRRFYLPKKASAFVTFMDDDPFIIREHEVMIGGDWKNKQYFTCLKALGKSCPLCEAENKSYLAGFFSLVDHTKWVDKKEKEHQNEAKLCAVKTQQLASFTQYSDEYDGLTGCLFKVTRTNAEKASRIGDTWIFKKRINWKKKFPELKPFDYKTILQPKSEKAMLRALGQSSTGEGEEGDASADTKGKKKKGKKVEDDVPF